MKDGVVRVRYVDISEKSVVDIRDTPKPVIVEEFGHIVNVVDGNLYLARDIYDDGGGRLTVIPVSVIVDVYRLSWGGKVALSKL